MSSRAPHSNTHPARTYLRVALLVYVAAGLYSAYRYTSQLSDMEGCVGSGYDSDHYLAACRGSGMHSYGHAALYYPTEPAAFRRLRDADVVFLGNSRMMWGFSHEVTRDYFARWGVRHYLLGFGHAERYGFIGELLKRKRLQPKLWVVNTDPFFRRAISREARQIVEGGRSVQVNYWIRRFAQQVHRFYCDRASGETRERWCDGRRSIFRSRTDGHWRQLGFQENAKQLVDRKPERRRPRRAQVELAGELLELSGVSPDCLVLTTVPSSKGTGARYARRLARRLGAHFVRPEVGPLFTFDKSHLRRDSGRRFADAFLQELRPHVERCVGRELPRADAR